MEEFTLSMNSKKDFTAVSNTFIDEYMSDANGEYVKLYIYLLRNALDKNKKFSFSDMSNRLDLTIKEIKRALQYWCDKKLLAIKKKDDSITEIILLSCNCIGNEQDDNKMDVLSENNVVIDGEVSGDEPFEFKKDVNCDINNPGTISTFIAKKDINAFMEQEDIKKLMFVAQQYLGRILSNIDIQSILFIYDKLKFDTQLIEHLLAYCVSNKHTNMRYIEKVAIDWASKNVTDIDSAKMITNNYCQEYYDILKSLGIRNRSATSEEIVYMKKWLKEWKFDIEIVKKACDKTMISAAKPSFNYVEAILSKWHECDVKTLEDIDALDLAFKNKKKKKVSGGNFDFEQRDYDYDQIELDWLNR